jgi:DNA-binding IclR family transcriptional regulator
VTSRQKRSARPVHAALPRRVEHALRLLEAVSRHPDGATVTTLAREVGIPEPQVNTLLPMLESESYLRRLPDGTFALSMAGNMLGSAAREAYLRSRLSSRLALLCDELSAAVYFSRYQEGELHMDVIVDRPQAPRVYEWLDFRASAHASAIGKCLLSQLDRDARRDHLSRHRAVRLTSRTIIDEQSVLDRLDLLDTRPTAGPVLDLQEYAVGTVCAAVPVPLGRTAGCLALSLPIRHAHRLRKTATLLADRAVPVLLSLLVV